MVRARKAIAVAALAALGGLIVTTGLRGPGGTYERGAVAMWALLLPLAITMGGLAGNRYWARWLAIAAGIAVLPWAAAFTFGPRYGLPVTRPLVALIASLLLIGGASGAVMFDHYEGRASGMDWRGPRMSIVRWTVICNVASALGLYVFVAAYDYQMRWHHALLASLLLGLGTGVVLLAHQRTIGLLVVALCCVLFVPAGAEFVLTEASDAGETILFAVIFAPGVLTGWASLFAFSKPLWRALRVD